MASCSWVPNAIVRVAVPPDQASARALWAAVTGVEVVAPGSFPPPDLVWFEGTFDSPEFRDQALGFNAEIEAQARASGLAPGWVTDTGDRVLPLAWSPWAWWTSDRPAATPGHPLVPYRQRDNWTALALVTSRSQGPTLGQDAGTAVWSVWGKAAQEEGKALVATEALKVWVQGHHDRLWLDWATVASPQGTGLVPEEAKVVAVRIRGVWWNAQGWDRDRVVGLMARLWSPEGQKTWAQAPGWLPVNPGVPLAPQAARVQALGTHATEFVAVQTPANE